MTTPATRPTITFDLTVLDTPDPQGLASFYAELLGWAVVRTEDDWVTIRGAGGSGIAFQLAPDLVPPTWPDNAVPQQFHIDFNVTDLDAAEEFAVSIGARKYTGEVSSTSFRVFFDPTGHPFCLCQV